MRHLALFVAYTCLAGCSGQSPVTPTTTPRTSSIGVSQPFPTGGNRGVGSEPFRAAPGVEGSYTLSFYILSGGAMVPVTTLPVEDAELYLKAEIVSASGPADRGSVVFEYCSFGGPRHDVSSADEAPAAVCESGEGRWVRLNGVRISESFCPDGAPGTACAFYGVVAMPRTVGFRFTYRSQGGDIADGESQPLDFLWTAL